MSSNNDEEGKNNSNSYIDKDGKILAQHTPPSPDSRILLFTSVGILPHSHFDILNAYMPGSICEKFLVPASNYKIALLLSRKIL